MGEKCLPDPTYLGDGVYANFDGYHVMLITSDGRSTTNLIFLDPHVLTAFQKYVGNVEARQQEETQ